MGLGKLTVISLQVPPCQRICRMICRWPDNFFTVMPRIRSRSIRLRSFACVVGACHRRGRSRANARVWASCAGVTIRSLCLTRFEAKQRVVPTPLKGSGDQSVSGIALLIALLGERGLILSTFNAHLPLTHDGLIALLKFLQRCYGQFEFGRL